MIDAQKANYTIARMARLLHVSRAGFYAWTHRLLAPVPRKTARTVMDAQVKLAHEDSEGVYGAPRVAALRREGIPVDRKTVARSMRRQGLEGISPRRFRPVTTIREWRSITFRIGSAGRGIRDGWTRCGFLTSLI